jgi:hypothetical protein
MPKRDRTKNPAFAHIFAIAPAPAMAVCSRGIAAPALHRGRAPRFLDFDGDRHIFMKR